MRVQCSDSSVTFHYAGKQWLRTQLLPTDWPDLGKVLDRPSSPQPLPAGLFDALAVVKPFVDKLGRVYFREGAVHTSTVEGEGASHDVEGLHTEGVFNVEMLQLLDGVERADFTAWPGPVMFFNGTLRGAIIGMRA